MRKDEVIKWTEYVDENGETVSIHNDEIALPDIDRNEVLFGDKDVGVAEEDGYQPPPWQKFHTKVDNGMIMSMLKVFRYTHLTEVQEMIISRMPIQKNLLVRSKTGTGKTIAFLVPAVQRHIDHMNKVVQGEKIQDYAKVNIGTLIISPTRELASQIAAEARRLTYGVKPSSVKTQVLVGGESKYGQMKRIASERNDIWVATPGRLLDYLQNEAHIVKPMLENLQTLILDETDSLLEMGFRHDIEEILRELGSTEKQRLTMMFSATISNDVKSIAKRATGKTLEFLNTVKPTDLDVHQKVKQTYIVQPMKNHIKTLLSLLITEQLRQPEGKVIVFFNTTKQVQLYAGLFRILRKLYPNEHFQQFEIHSRKSQDQRSKVNKAFRTANVGSVLFTSDVSCALSRFT
jgi:ATP-dependent RNA helicase MSS116, mitochondrial